MTAADILKAEFAAAQTENTMLRAAVELSVTKTPRAAVRERKTSRVIHYPKAHDGDEYQIDAQVSPKLLITLSGNRPNYEVEDDSRGMGRHRVMSFIVSFKIGDAAIYDGYNFCYFGTIVGIGKKTVTIESGGSRRRLSIARFAFWNRRDHRFARDERNSWSD